MAGEVPAQFVHKGPDLGGSAPAGLRPLVHVNPPVLAGSAREPGQQMDVQMRDRIADHRRIHMLGLGYVTQSPARPRAPPAHAPGFSIGKVSQARCVPPRLDEQMPQMG